MADLSQSATLLAAIIAATAAIAGVVVTSLNARRVARESATAALQREDRAFRRQRLAEMRDMLFENAIALQSLSECCKSIPWLTRKPLEEIHERGETNISKLLYAAQVIQEMGEAIHDQGKLIRGLPILFHSFCSAIYFYKQQIELGNIEPSGQARQEARDAESRFTSAAEDWSKHMKDLKQLVAQSYANHKADGDA